MSEQDKTHYCTVQPELMDVSEGCWARSKVKDGASGKYLCSNNITRCSARQIEKSNLDKPCGPAAGTAGLKFDSGKQPWFAMPLEVLEPLADVFAAGEKKYATFNCLQPFENPDRRFYDGMMRHAAACQRDPLAIDAELNEKYGVEVYHAAQVAFNALLRLYHAKKGMKK
jgi:hypothetical protein